MQHAEAVEEERAALVALLGEWDGAVPRRRYTAWSAIATHVRRRGSALAVWNERHPLTLDGSGEWDNALSRAGPAGSLAGSGLRAADGAGSAIPVAAQPRTAHCAGAVRAG